jgi:hypothetical protein
MANALFDKGRQKFLEGSIAWLTDNIKLVLVDHGVDTPNPSTDEFLSDIAAGARVATSGNFTGKTSTNGVADADDVTLTAVSGASVESIVIYKDTGTETTSPLIAFIDTATGLPLTPNGGDVIVVWDNGGRTTRQAPVPAVCWKPLRASPTRERDNGRGLGNQQGSRPCGLTPQRLYAGGPRGLRYSPSSAETRRKFWPTGSSSSRRKGVGCRFSPAMEASRAAA